MKTFEELTPRERHNMQVILQGILQRRNAVEEAQERLAHMLNITTTDVEDYFENILGSAVQIAPEDVQEFWDQFVF